MTQHELNVEYLKAKGWVQERGGWIPNELAGTNANPWTFEMAMNIQCDLDGEPRDIACLVDNAGSVE